MEFSDFLEFNNYTVSNFPKNKFPILPLDNNVLNVKWGENEYNFDELFHTEAIPPESRLDNGIVYFSDGYEVNQSFDSALLLTTHGIVIRNPSVEDKIEYLFLSFSEFSEVEIFTIQNSGMPLIRLAKEDFGINISTSMVMDMPINQPEEVVFLYNTLKCIIEESFSSTDNQVELEMSNMIFLKTSSETTNSESSDISGELQEKAVELDTSSNVEEQSKKKSIWEIIQFEFKSLNRSEIPKKDFISLILEKHPDIKKGTLSAQINIQVVNKKARTGYYQCNKPRVCGEDKFDFL